MIIRAATSSFHTVSFFDENSTPVQPSAGTYTVKDMATGDTIKSATAFTPTTPWYLVSLSDTDNAMHGSSHVLERHQLTVNFTYGSTKKGVASQVFVVNNANVTVEDVMTDLEGWVLNTTDPARYDVTEDMVETYIIKAMRKAARELYLNGPNDLPSNNEVVDDAILDWAAGLLWKWKYTVSTPDATLLPYGDGLIADAKTSLLSFKEIGPSSSINAHVDDNIGEFEETEDYYAFTQRQED